MICLKLAQLFFLWLLYRAFLGDESLEVQNSTLVRLLVPLVVEILTALLADHHNDLALQNLGDNKLLAGVLADFTVVVDVAQL